MKNKQKKGLFQPELVRAALWQSVVKLDPRQLFRNPVMFTVEIGTAIMLVVTLLSMMPGADVATLGHPGYNFVIFGLLLLTVLFANFAEAFAEARGKAQAESLRKTRKDTPAKKINPDGTITVISSSELRRGDQFVCEAGDIIPTDGEIIEGLATIDESAITGESAPVIREAGATNPV